MVTGPPTWEALVAEFGLRYANAGTRRQYEAELAGLFRFAAVGHPTLLSESVVLAWCGLPAANNTVRNRLSRLSTFLRWCVRQEAVYLEEVEALARAADSLIQHDAGDALAVWLTQFVEYATTKKTVIEALNLDSPVFTACIEIIHRAGEPLLARAQNAGTVRSDLSFDDLRQLMTAIASVNFVDDEQRQRRA